MAAEQPPRPHDEDYATPKEAATRFRVSTRTIYEMVARQELPAVRVGRQWRIPRRTLDELAAARDSGRRPAASEAIAGRS